MVKNYSFGLCEPSGIILLVALYNKEAWLRSCETKTHAHIATRSFNTQLYKNPRSISVYTLHVPRLGPSRTILFRIRHLQRAGSTWTQETVLSPAVGAVQVEPTKEWLE